MSEPIRDTITVFRCPFCRRSRTRRSATAEHMRHCFKNPERTPRAGELSRWWYGEDRDEPAWWPGEGMIFDGSTWLPVPGFKVSNGLEIWPICQDKPLDQWHRALRLDALSPIAAAGEEPAF